MKLGILMMVVFGTFILVGCKDKAKDGYERCIKLEQSNEIRKAWYACGSAALDDPNSKSGKAAAEKEKQLKPIADKILADINARDSAAQRAQQATVLQVLRTKIHRSKTFREEDDHCAGEGKPGHSYRYGGGTYTENERLAGADGCVPYDKDAMAVAGNAQNHFCCP
jgi:hypothetical protein